MNNQLQRLFDRRAELWQRIAKIDDLIRAEIEDKDRESETGSRDRGAVTQKEPVGSLAIPATKSMQTDAAPAKTQGVPKPLYTYPSEVRTWSDKIIYMLKKAGGDGMTSAELIQALQAAERGTGVPMKSVTIYNTLHHLEKKSRIRVERSLTGRKLHYSVSA